MSFLVCEYRGMKFYCEINSRLLCIYSFCEYGYITRIELSYFRIQRAILSTDSEIMASDARSNGTSLSPEVPLLSTCKDLQSNSDVFGCDVRPNAICIRYSWKKTANRRYFRHNTSQFCE